MEQTQRHFPGHGTDSLILISPEIISIRLYAHMGITPLSHITGWLIPQRTICGLLEGFISLPSSPVAIT